MRVQFALVAEGPADRALVRPLQDLCLECGATEASGSAPDLRRLPIRVGGRAQDKLQAVVRLVPDAELYFVHRDSDSSEYDRRYREIARAVEQVHVGLRWVGVVPVRETEAWALLDENAIRTVAENPRGRMDLGLAAPSGIEQIADPKRRLRDALALASGLSGRRLTAFRRTFQSRRWTLLERIDVNGPIRQLPAWRRLRDHLSAAIDSL